MELTYHQEGDYLIPNLEVDKQPERPLNKYGRMRLAYLKEHRRTLYSQLFLKVKLKEHCLEIGDAAQERLDEMMPQLAKAAGATEELKARDPMKWVWLMNNCKAQAEEIILAELVYA